MKNVGHGLVNAMINTVQELRAKRQLDRIALLTPPTMTVLRAQGERTVDPTEVVKGDILRLRPGDQVAVDGTIVNDGSLEVDEALLTGESSPISKHDGDQVLSGSFCVSGEGYYRADKVGTESYASQMTGQFTRRFSRRGHRFDPNMLLKPRFNPTAYRLAP